MEDDESLFDTIPDIPVLLPEEVVALLALPDGGKDLEGFSDVILEACRTAWKKTIDEDRRR